VKAEEATREAGEGELVVCHHPVDRVVHAAVGPSQRQPGSEDGAQRRVDHGEQLESHDEGSDDEVESLHHLRGAGARGRGGKRARGGEAARRQGGGCPPPPKRAGARTTLASRSKGTSVRPYHAKPANSA